MVTVMAMVLAQDRTMKATKEIIVLLGAFLVSPSIAGILTVEPEIGVALHQSDNIALSDEDTLEDFILDIEPALNINYEGNTFTSSFAVTGDLLSYQDNDENNEQFLQADALVSAEMLKDRLWFNWLSSIDQRSISDDADQNNDIIFANNNVTDVADHIFQPVFRYNSTNFNAEAIYNFAKQRVEETVIGNQDSDTESLVFIIGSDPETGRYNWRLDTFTNETILEDESSNKLSNAELLLSTTMNSNLRLGIRAGRDKNTFESLNNDFIENDYWLANLVWTPNPRMTFDLSSGKRFDIDDTSITLTYRGRYLEIDLSSETELSNNGFNTPRASVADLNTNQVLQPPLTNDVLLRNADSLRIGYIKRKIDTSITYVKDNQESQTTNNINETDESINFQFAWQIQSRTSLILDFQQTNDEVLDALNPGRVDTIETKSFTLLRNISPNSDFSLTVRKQERESTGQELDYIENGAEVNFIHRF